MNAVSSSPVEVGLGLFQTHPPAQFIELVQLSEQYGYRQLWIASERFWRDPTVQLTLATTHTSRVGLGTFVADPYTEHPALIAARIATLDELSGQRAILMLGAGGTGLDRMGIARTSPVVALREAVSIIRALLASETVESTGKVLHAHGARLAFPARRDIPIGIATRGKKMLALAGEIADSVMISTFATPQGVTFALEQIAAGVKRAGRSFSELDLISRVDVCLAEGEIGRAVVRRFLCRSLAASYPDRNWVQAVGIRIPQELETVFAKRNGDLAQSMADELPDEIVEQFGWVGKGATIAEKISAVTALGIHKIAIVPQLAPGQTHLEFVRAFAEQVMPRIHPATQ